MRRGRDRRSPAPRGPLAVRGGRDPDPGVPVQPGARPRADRRARRCRPGLVGSFVVADLGELPEAGDGTVEDGVLHREIYVRDELVEGLGEVAVHQRVFARYWRQSLAGEASRVLILARAH
ncbi:hypothetical protein [Actinoplanes regularis]|uniref:hypothetical protein n=1 Tax=Actinoplanes regularis TaxID=52697 RepID=UPI002555F7EE|nr:hypothetical protein [Actinoplanes regularis]GLW28090.1 hypothetical protein Areg01_10300 [Actinoplanes regularis]